MTHAVNDEPFWIFLQHYLIRTEAFPKQLGDKAGDTHDKTARVTHKKIWTLSYEHRVRSTWKSLGAPLHFKAAALKWGCPQIAFRRLLMLASKWRLFSVLTKLALLSQHVTLGWLCPCSKATLQKILSQVRRMARWANKQLPDRKETPSTIRAPILLSFCQPKGLGRDAPTVENCWLMCYKKLWPAPLYHLTDVKLASKGNAARVASGCCYAWPSTAQAPMLCSGHTNDIH